MFHILCLGWEDLKNLVSQISWGNNLLILQKVKDLDARLFYLQTCIKNRCSRAALLHQIKADAYRNYLKMTNFLFLTQPSAARLMI